MEMSKKYDATRLPTMIESCEEYIDEFSPINTREKAVSFMKYAPSLEEIQDEHNKLEEFISFRQGKADALKEQITSCKNKEDKQNLVDELKKLCNGKTVGLIYLRECERIMNDLLELYTDSEKIINSKIESVKGFKTGKKTDEGKKLLELLKAPAAGCGTPSPEVANVEQDAIEESIEKKADEENAALQAMILVDKHLTQFEEPPDEAMHELAREIEGDIINEGKAEITDSI